MNINTKCEGQRVCEERCFRGRAKMSRLHSELRLCYKTVRTQNCVRGSVSCHVL